MANRKNYSGPYPAAVARNLRAPYGVVSNVPGGAPAPGASGPTSEGSEDANDGRSAPTTAPGVTGSEYGEALGAEVETEWSNDHPTKGGVDIHPAFDLDDEDDSAS